MFYVLNNVFIELENYLWVFPWILTLGSNTLAFGYYLSIYPCMILLLKQIPLITQITQCSYKTHDLNQDYNIVSQICYAVCFIHEWRTCNLNSTLNDRFFRNFFVTIFYLFHKFLSDIWWEEVSEKIFFHKKIKK